MTQSGPPQQPPILVGDIKAAALCCPNCSGRATHDKAAINSAVFFCTKCGVELHVMASADLHFGPVINVATWQG